MKATIASVALILSLLGASLTAADSTPVTLSAEHQFQQADVQLAVEQYKKLRMAAFDIAFKIQTENALSDDQLKQLNDIQLNSKRVQSSFAQRHSRQPSLSQIRADGHACGALGCRTPLPTLPTPAFRPVRLNKMFDIRHRPLLSLVVVA
jgi:hypothetical protein